jgi:hypothetical protein
MSVNFNCSELYAHHAGIMKEITFLAKKIGCPLNLYCDSSKLPEIRDGLVALYLQRQKMAKEVSKTPPANAEVVQETAKKGFDPGDEKS